jgi:peptide/nickel transport system substrate-binding protein
VNDFEDRLVDEGRTGRMTRRDLVRGAAALGVSSSALLSACSWGSNQETTAAKTAAAGPARRGGTARIGAPVAESDLEPLTMYSPGAFATTQCAGEYLCFPDASYKLVPKLATSWKAVKPDVWEFEIRQGVKWHDGSPLSVDDVVATFERIIDPDSKSSARSALAGVLSKGATERVGETTVRFNLDRGFVDFPALVSAFNRGSMILPKDYEIGQFIKGGIGTGPFILKQYAPKQKARLERNPHYWQPSRPYLDAIEFTYFDDTPPIVLALQAGEIDVFPLTPFQGSEPLYKDPKITVLEAASSQYRAVNMRVDEGPFKDRRVREALALCLDREAIVQGLFGGRAQIGNDHAFAPIYAGTELAQRQVPQRRQDYAMAKKLLADAGHPDGLKVSLTTQQLLEIPQYAITIKEQCKPAGIDVKLDTIPSARFYGEGTNQPWLVTEFGIVDWGARGSAGQTIAPAFLCRSVPSRDLSNADAAWNSAHWCNPRFGKLVSSFDAELDEDKRAAIAAEAAKIQHDEVPSIIAYWLKEQRATRSNVHGLSPGPASYLDPSGMWLS